MIKFTLGGVTVQQAKFKQLPSFLAARAQAALVSLASTVAADIAASYPQRSGFLASRVIVRSQPRQTKARVVIANTAKYALAYEFGSKPRTTKKRGRRGQMPAAHTFVPRIMRARVDFIPKVAAIMRAEGLTVSGG